MGNAQFIPVILPNQNIGAASGDSAPGLGHAGFILVDSSGNATFYEYGPYQNGATSGATTVLTTNPLSPNTANVRATAITAGTVQFDSSGNITEASLQSVLNQVFGPDGPYAATDPGIVSATPFTLNSTQYTNIASGISSFIADVNAGGIDATYGLFGLSGNPNCINFVYGMANAAGTGPNTLTISTTQTAGGVSIPTAAADNILTEADSLSIPTYEYFSPYSWDATNSQSSIQQVSSFNAAAFEDVGVQFEKALANFGQETIISPGAWIDQEIINLGSGVTEWIFTSSNSDQITETLGGTSSPVTVEYSNSSATPVDQINYNADGSDTLDSYNTSGILSDALTDNANGTSQLQTFTNVSLDTTEIETDYTGENDTGTQDGIAFDLTDGNGITFGAGTYSNPEYTSSSAAVSVTLTSPTGLSLGTLAFNTSTNADSVTLPDGLAVSLPGILGNITLTAPASGTSPLNTLLDYLADLGDTTTESALNTANLAYESSQGITDSSTRAVTWAGTTLTGTGADGQELTASLFGNDTLNAGNGTGDTLVAGEGVDTLTGGTGGDTFLGGTSDGYQLAPGSTVTGSGSGNRLQVNGDITGSTISDIQTLTTNDVTLTADQFNGFTSIVGLDGVGGTIDAATSGTYDLSAKDSGGETFDMTALSDGGTTLIANSGDNATLTASATGNDTLDASAGGFDTLVAGGGTDTLIGGGGATFMATGGLAPGSTVTGDGDSNTLDVSGDITGSTVTGVTTLIIDGADSVTLTATQFNGFTTVEGPAGSDVFAATGGTYDIPGNPGGAYGPLNMTALSDAGTTLEEDGASGIALIASATGNDTLTASGGTGNVLDALGSTGNDTLDASGDTGDTLYASDGSDTIYSGLTGTIYGGGGSDTIYSGLTGTIYGGGGSDTIYDGSEAGGGGFSTAIDGGTGNDTVYIGGGEVSIEGGSGNNTYTVSGLLAAGSFVAGGIGGDNTLIVGGSGASIARATVDEIQTLEVTASTLAIDSFELLSVSNLVNDAGGTVTLDATANSSSPEFTTFDLADLNVTGDFNISAATDRAAVTLTGNNQDGQTLTGGAGNGQTLIAGNGAGDTLTAGNGTGDMLVAGTGVDTLTGGTGGDTFTAAGGLAAGSAVTGHGTGNTLVATGDILGATITDIQTLELTGNVILTSAQYAEFTTVEGSGTSIVADSAITAAAAAALAGETGITPVEVVDTAANVSANFNALQTLAADSELSLVALTDPGTPVLPLTATQYADDTGAIAAIAGTYSIAVSGVLAADAATVAAGTNVASVGVSDSAANVTSNIAALQTLAAGGELASIALTGATPALTFDAADASADADALSLLTGAYTLTVSDSAANVAGNIDALGTLAAIGALTAITLTDSGTPALSITETQAANDAAALAVITTPFAVTLGSDTAAAFNGAGDDVTLAGSGNVVTANGSHTEVYDGSTGGNTITLAGTDDSADLTGTGDTVTATGTGVGINDWAGGNTITLGTSDTATLYGVGSTVTVLGDSGSTVNDYGGTGGDATTLDGDTGVAILDNVGSSVAMNGNEDSAWLYSNEESAAVNGTNGVVTIESNDNIVNVAGTGNTVNDSGSGNTITLGGTSNDAYISSGDQISITGTDGVIDGTGDNTITLQAGASDTDALIYGSGNETTANGTGAYLLDVGTGNNSFTLGGSSNEAVFYTTGDTVTATGGSDFVYDGGGNNTTILNGTDEGASLHADGSTATANGTGDTIGLSASSQSAAANGTNDTINIGGSGDTATFSGSGDSFNVSGSGDNTITVEASASGTTGYIWDSGDTVTINGTGAYIADVGSGDNTFTVAGTDNQSVFYTSGDMVTLTGAGDSDSVYDAGDNTTVLSGTDEGASLHADGSTATANGTGDTVGLSASSQSAAANGTNDTINIGGSGDTATFSGSGDSFNVSGSGDNTITVEASASGTTGYVWDSGDTVTINGTGAYIADVGSGDNTFTLGGSSNQAVLYTSGDTVTATGTGDFIYDAGANTSILNGDSEGASLHADGSTATANGTGDSIGLNASSQSATDNGTDDTVSITSGDTASLLGTGGTLSDAGSDNTITLGGSSNTATISNTGSNTLTLGGTSDTMDITGTTGTDTVDITGTSALLQFAGATTDQISFGSGAAGTMFLESASSFAGTVAGLADGDSIDLGNFLFSGSPTISDVTGSGAADTATDVTVTDGSQSTVLALLNQYANQFAVSASAYTLTADGSSGSAGTLFQLAAGH